MRETLPDHAAAGWIEVDVSKDRGRSVPENGRVFQKGPLLAMRSLDDGRWHLSVSTATRLPTWEELGMARDELLPADLFYCIPQPPRAYWMNIHPYCLHFYEVRDTVLVRLWREIGTLAQSFQARFPAGPARQAAIQKIHRGRMP